MAKPSHMREIRDRIAKADPGSMFIPSDFADIAEMVKINMCLTRLKERGVLHSVKRGVYMKPRHSILLNKAVPPRSDDIAQAIARNHGWTIIPCGDTALNALGISTQVPTVWLYVSDGPYKAYEIDGFKLSFKHTDRKNELIGVSYDTALIIQALRAIGKGNIDNKILQKLSDKLNQQTKTQMLAEGKHITAWIYECIKKICVGQQNPVRVVFQTGQNQN